MKNRNRVLCIVAHPDDEALGVGGTLIKHAEQGDEVYIIILSDGEASKIKKKEKNPSRNLNAKAWSAETGCMLHNIYNFPDQKLDSVPELDIVKLLERDIEKIKPKIVYTHFYQDLNKDHRVTANATFAAIRPISRHRVKAEIRTFETPSSSDQSPQIQSHIFTPNFYVDITNQWKLKENSLKNYKLEMKPFPHPRSLKTIKALAIKRGAESGLKMAEAFCITRKIWN